MHSLFPCSLQVDGIAWVWLLYRCISRPKTSTEKVSIPARRFILLLLLISYIRFASAFEALWPRCNLVLTSMTAVLILRLYQALLTQLNLHACRG